MINLVSNATKFSKRQCEIFIDVERKKIRDGFDKFEISVAD